MMGICDMKQEKILLWNVLQNGRFDRGKLGVVLDQAVFIDNEKL